MQQSRKGTGARTPYWQKSLLISLVAVVYINAMGFLGTATLVPSRGWADGAKAVDGEADTLQGRFARWDSGYYLRIAKQGYRPDGAERAFFPLYPMLTRLASDITGMSVLWCGWVISVACFAAAGLVLYRWMLSEFDPQIAGWSLLWFSVFPMAFFDTAFYPEALFHLTSIAAIYCCRRGWFALSGLCIALAGAARPVAFLLAIPFFVEFIRQRDFRARRWADAALGCLLAPLGTGAYFLFLSAQSGWRNPLAVYDENLARHWKMATVWPWVTLHDGLRAAIFRENVGPEWFAVATIWYDLLYVCLGLALAIWCIRKIPWSLSLLMVCGMIFFLTSRGPNAHVFEGMPRHVASLFPTYVILGVASVRLPTWARLLAVSASAASLGLLSAWFASGRWVS